MFPITGSCNRTNVVNFYESATHFSFSFFVSFVQLLTIEILLNEMSICFVIILQSSYVFGETININITHVSELYVVLSGPFKPH